jgi:hypothetical protein
MQLSPITFQHWEMGTGLAPVQATEDRFWEHLRSLGGTWMWEYIKEGKIDMVWLRDTLINGMLIGITDGSFDRHKAKSSTGLGWILVCTASKRTLRGLFYEISAAAGSYRSKLQITGVSCTAHPNSCGSRLLQHTACLWKNMLR